MAIEVSVLGAGPAGSTAAYELARRGIDVELIDREHFPRDKPCAGALFNPELFTEEFPYVNEVEGKLVYRARMCYGDRRFEVTSPKPLVKTIFREDFDFFLMKKAVAAGAVFAVGKKPEGTFIIDATGVKAVHSYAHSGICLVNDFHIEQELDMVHVHYCYRGIIGYSWVYPKKGHVNIGVGAYLPQRNIKEIYESYVKFLIKEKILSEKEAGAKQYKAKMIPFAPLKHFFSGRTLFAGDAAGFVRPGTGEGIYFAMLSGKLAAETIARNKEFHWYEKMCRIRFGDYLVSTRVWKKRFFLTLAMKKAVRIGSKSPEFAHMMVEDFFRLRTHSLAREFLKRIFT
jgi:flavin-dependent dehydrogenase